MGRENVRGIRARRPANDKKIRIEASEGGFGKDRNMKTKKMLSMVLSCALVLSSFSGSFVQSTKAKAGGTKEKLVVYVAAEGKNDSGTTVSLDKTPVMLEQGATALTASDAIKKALDQSEYQGKYTISTGTNGEVLDEINGIQSFQISPDDPYDWAFYINGEYSMVGISGYTLQDQDEISLIFTYENSNTECGSFQDNSSLNPDEAKQQELLANAKAQQEVLAQKIYEAQFDGGERIPGIEDASGLYTVFSLAQAGFKADNFYDAVYSKISQQFAGLEQFGKFYDETLEKEITWESLATDSSLGKNALSQYYAKIALCVLALGKNPADVGGVNLYQKLLDKEIYNASGIYSRESMILFAIDAKSCDLPTGESYLTRADLVEALLADVDNQIQTSIAWSSYDSAAMAVQALAPYVTETVEGIDSEQVKAARDKVLNFLSVMQNDKGSYPGSGTDNNAWTLAQVMTTMGCFQISALKEKEDVSGFIRNGKTVLDAASAFVDVEKKTVDSVLMGFQPEQLLRGLNAVIRTAEEKETIYQTEQVAYTANPFDKTLIAPDMISKIPTQYYEGKACIPKVTVTHQKKVLTEGVDYTVVYQNNTSVGTAYVIVSGKGDYALSQQVSFQIAKKNATNSSNNNNSSGDSSVKDTSKKTTVLKRPVIKKITSPKKKTLKVTFKKVSGAKKYVVEVSTNKKFKKSVKKKTVKKTEASFSKLKSKKKYYVRVRAYQGRTKSAYSKVKSKKIK